MNFPCRAIYVYPSLRFESGYGNGKCYSDRLHPKFQVKHVDASSWKYKIFIMNVDQWDQASHQNEVLDNDTQSEAYITGRKPEWGVIHYKDMISTEYDIHRPLKVWRVCLCACVHARVCHELFN